MCDLRPLAIAVAPIVVRDLPPSISSDAFRHTWPSYHRTLERVVVGYRPAPDLAVAPSPVTFLTGFYDGTAPLASVRRLVDDLTSERTGVEVRAVPGDHHLSVRHPDQVAEVIAELLATPDQAP